MPVFTMTEEQLIQTWRSIHELLTEQLTIILTVKPTMMYLFRAVQEGLINQDEYEFMAFALCDHHIFTIH